MVEEETVGRKGKKGQTRYQRWRGCMDVDGAGGMWKCGNVGTLKGPGAKISTMAGGWKRYRKGETRTGENQNEKMERRRWENWR